MTPERAMAQQVSCIHETFERVASARASHIAVVCGDEQWTYEKLNQESNRIAHALIGLGIEQEEPVAIALPRSCASIAAMLGILKAGGAYVPIVENQPIPRLRSILNNSNVRFMIGYDVYFTGLRDSVERVITRDMCASQPKTNPHRPCDPNDLAYILFTSGSTGEPKGVMIEHDGIHRLVHDQWFMPVGEDTNYLCVSSFGFDASTIEIYAALLHGATLVMTSKRVPEPDEVRTLIRSHDVRAAWIAFGFFSAIFESDPSIFDTVDVIMTGGEPVHAELIRKAQRALPETRFVNSYGPTECTALSTAYEIPLLEDDASGLIPIGRALRSMRCDVVDEHGQRVEVGQRGELLISGMGIMRGYLYAPEQTQQRLLVDNEGQRTFRSGDLVRMQPDGNLMFLGRKDAQVKLRGNRFELGDVESIARSHPHVDESIACIVNSASRPELALLVVTSESDIDQLQFEEYMRQQLPEYMVPTHVFSEASIPLTRNGKADRDAACTFIEQQLTHSRDQDNAGAFRTETEARLATLMSEVLNVPVLDRTDRFLNLGGHSLRALVLSARIDDFFDVRLSISTLYQLANIERIAAAIDERSSDTGNDRVELERVDPGNPAPLSFNQLRLWMHDQIHPGDPSYTITIRLDHHKPLDRSAFDRAWQIVCERHAVLKSRITIVNDEPCMVVDSGLDLHPNWNECAEENVVEIESMIERASMRSFDLDSGPLVRCNVYQGPTRVSVAIMMHHLISDAWSCSILQRELADVYESNLSGQSLNLPELRIQYADFARWERTVTDRASYQSDLREWCASLRDAPVLRLPADHPQSRHTSSVGIREEVVVDADTMRRLHAVSNELGVTPFVYMLSIFNAWLARLTLTEDIVIGSPVANRRSADTQSLIGFFMETLPLRNQIDLNRTLREIVTDVYRNTMMAFDRRDVPFQHIVQELGLLGQSDANPLFEVFFNHIAIPLRSEEHATLAFSDHDTDNHTAKFDLTCYFFEEQDRARIVFNARRSMFSPQSVRWFLQQFVSMLTASPSSLDSAIADLPMDMTPIESLNPAKIPAPSLPTHRSTTGTILDRVQRVVHEHPRAIAVCSHGGAITYAELWDRSAQIATALQDHGILKGDRVMLVVDDAIETSAAILGTLRVGGVYIPTDHRWPSHRIAQIAHASSPRAIILSSNTSAPDVRCPQIDLRDVVESRSPSTIDIHPDDAAYLMFTSGSTGSPKGVLQSHRSVVGHMVTFAHALNLQSRDSILQLSSFSFDASVMDMFACWFTGATLCVADTSMHTPNEIAEWIAAEQVSVFHAAPTLFRWFTHEIGDQVQLDHVRAVVLGGEHASEHDIDAVLTSFPSCNLLINGFGLTESSLNLHYRIDPASTPDWPSRLPIGYAVEGVDVRLVDPSGNPTIPTGEIEVMSDRIARSYINPDAPIGSAGIEHGTTRFRTGDIGTIRHDGSIMHLGRVDDQVQIRGCRVEPDEVVAFLQTLDSVEDASVLPHTDESGRAQLHAYIVCGEAVTCQDLTRQCAQHLPPYMIPEHWRRVHSIPRVGGGKADRRTLPQERTINFAHEARVDALPVDHATRVIIDGFASVLIEKNVGPDDNFFQLGGNSLRAIQLFSHLKESFQETIPISLIYRSPTPRLLAREYARHERAPEKTLIPLNATQSDRRVIVLPGIGGHPLGFGPLIDRVQQDTQFIGVQYPDEHVLDRIGRSLPSLASWVISRLNLETNEPIPDMIGYSFGGSLAMEIAMQLRQEHRTHGRLLLLDAHLPFGLPQRGRFGKARVHLARIVEGHETSRLKYITQRLRPKTNEPVTRDEHAEELDAYRAVSRINRKMVIEYQPARRYDGDVTLVRANQPEWLKFHHDDGFNGFGAIMDQKRIKRVEIDAGHLELFNPGPVAHIARVVDDWIDQS